MIDVYNAVSFLIVACISFQKTYDLFLLIQEEMELWINTTDATKTSFVYGNK